MKKVQHVVLLAVVAVLFSVSANAMQFNLDATDFINKQENLNISWVVYSKTGNPGPGGIAISEEQNKLPGLMWQHIQDWVNDNKPLFANMKPVDNYDGQHSQISLGYKKNGTDVAPPSCQNIRLTDVVNITMTEAGCTVTH